jgi:hypothetical protein
LNRWLLLFLLLLYWSCRPIEKNELEVTNQYYDINGLIDHQVKTLDSISLFLLKKAAIDGVEESVQFSQPDLAAWTKELSIFKSADINKSMLVGSYDIIEIKNADIEFLIYKSKTPENTQVDSLALSFMAEEKYPLKIHACITNSNALFESAKHLDLNFNNANRVKLLSSYKIEGWQKMISKDSTTYSIAGSITRN